MADSSWLNANNLPPKEANRRLRIQLAAAHRAIAEHRMCDGVVNHLSVYAPAADGSGEIILITPFPIDFREVTPASLLGINLQGKVVEGNGILKSVPSNFHRGVYSVAKNVRCIMHTHMEYATIIGVSEKPELYMGLQRSLGLYGEVAVDPNYRGLVENLEEGQRLGRALANKKAMLLCHHGALAVGDTVAETLYSLYSLEKGCEFQVKALSAGLKLKTLPPELCQKTHDQLHGDGNRIPDEFLYNVIVRLAKTSPEFAM